MPKLKTNSGAKKRFRVNKNGKVKFAKPFGKHNFLNKSPEQNRRSRGKDILGPRDAKKIKEVLPYDR